MIKLGNYILKQIDTFNEQDMTFFEKMNQDESFKHFFGKVSPSIVDKNNIFMNDYLLQANDRTVGYIHISDKISKGDIIATTLYYYIDDLYRGNGIATNALKELMEYLAREEKINYFILNIDKENTASIHVAINNGFVKYLEDEEEIQFVHKTL